jgi:hypothetical protein
MVSQTNSDSEFSLVIAVDGLLAFTGVNSPALIPHRRGAAPFFRVARPVETGRFQQCLLPGEDMPASGQRGKPTLYPGEE